MTLLVQEFEPGKGEQCQEEQEDVSGQTDALKCHSYHTTFMVFFLVLFLRVALDFSLI